MVAGMQAASRVRERLVNRGKRENEVRVRERIARDVHSEPFYKYSGKAGGSMSTILQSRPQRRLVLMSISWYAAQMLIYLVLANVLAYLTLHTLSPSSPSYPGKVSVNGPSAFQHEELADFGFMLTPNLGHRPFLLKAIFVDMMVTISQLCPPIILVLSGRTYELVCYTGLIGIQNILKGIVQLATVLPAARQGEVCWELNFHAAELDIMRNAPFSTWMFKPWGMTHGCNDMLWSGHTSQSCLGLLFIDKTLRHWNVPKFIRGFLVIYFICYMWAVLSCRMHYTIDVLVATIIAVTFFTHTPLRFWIWMRANHLCGNDEDENSDDDSEESYSDESVSESLSD